MARTARRRRVLVIFAIAALTGGLAIPILVVSTPGATHGSEDLRLAPAYAATTLDGDSVDLEQMRGLVVMLNVWATWCSACLEEMPGLQALQVELAASGFTVVGVSIDDGGEDAKVRAMADSLGVTYPVWRDPDNRVTATFRLIGVPQSLLITTDGYIAHEWKGAFDPVSEDARGKVRGVIDRGDGSGGRPGGGTILGDPLALGVVALALAGTTAGLGTALQARRGRGSEADPKAA